MLKTVYNEIDIASPALRLQPSVVNVNICLRALNLIQLIVPFTSPSSVFTTQLNRCQRNLPPKKDARSLIRLLKSIMRKASNLFGTHEKFEPFRRFVVWRRKKFQLGFG